MRRLIIAAATVLALVGCTGSQKRVSGDASPALLPPDEQSARQSIVFLIDREAEPLYKQAADVFSRRALEITGNYLTISVAEVDGAAAGFTAGDGHLALIDSRTGSGFSPDFATLSAPMSYKDYNAFTMGLNSRRMLDFIGEELALTRRALPLAAFYQGGSVFVSAGQLAGVLAVKENESYEDGLTGEELFAEDEQAADPPLVLLRQSSSIAGMLEQCGLRTSVEPSAAARAAAVEQGAAALAEFSNAELGSVSFGSISPNIVDRSHDLSPLWLIVDEARYAGLPPGYKAALQEAAAYMFPVIDGALQARETEILRRVRDGGGTLERSFPELDKAAASFRQSEAEKDFRKKYITDILQGMS